MHYSSISLLLLLTLFNKLQISVSCVGHRALSVVVVRDLDFFFGKYFVGLKQWAIKDSTFVLATFAAHIETIVAIEVVEVVSQLLD